MKELNIIPNVSKFSINSGNFILQADTLLVATTLAEKQVASLLCRYLERSTGFCLNIVDNIVNDNAIIIQNGDTSSNDESYMVNIDSKIVHIKANAKQGLFLAIQTLRQLLPPEVYSDSIIEDCVWKIPCVKIEDIPKFSWRGLQLDVSRHFFSKDEVCRIIELAAQYKFNVFHWHLTDDQGWRIEIKKYPKLTEVGAWRSETLIGHDESFPHIYDGIKHGGFYTQKEIKEVVNFASERGINILPEIDMPGHMQAAIASYPELGTRPTEVQEVRCRWGICQNILNPSQFTMDFMKDILIEVMGLFPFNYVHLGGDEVKKYEWENNKSVNKRMVEVGVKNAYELQNYFMNEMVLFVQSKGKNAIGWDEILEGGALVDETTIMSWRGEEGGIKAAMQKHNVIMSPESHTYLNHYQTIDTKNEPQAYHGYTSVEKIYSYNPVPKSLLADYHQYILGGQAQLWTEYVPDLKNAEYMLFPRLCAIAEKLWCDENNCNFFNFLERLKNHRNCLKMQNVNMHKLP